MERREASGRWLSELAIDFAVTLFRTCCCCYCSRGSQVVWMEASLAATNYLPP